MRIRILIFFTLWSMWVQRVRSPSQPNLSLTLKIFFCLPHSAIHHTFLDYKSSFFFDGLKWVGVGVTNLASFVLLLMRRGGVGSQWCIQLALCVHCLAWGCLYLDVSFCFMYVTCLGVQTGCFQCVWALQTSKIVLKYIFGCQKQTLLQLRGFCSIYNICT